MREMVYVIRHRVNYDGRYILFFVSHGIASGLSGICRIVMPQAIRMAFLSLMHRYVKKIFQGFLIATMRRSMSRNPTIILRGTMTAVLSGI